MATSNAVFVDSSGWIAVLNQDDRYHPHVLDLFTRLARDKRPLVTTDWVFAESGNGLARVNVRRQFAETIRRFLSSENCRMIRIDEDHFARAVELYATATDKTWGLVDCASFVAMRDADIWDAATTDHHFEQAGFRCLLSTI
jgi:uncharacterized protein